MPLTIRNLYRVQGMDIKQDINLTDIVSTILTKTTIIATVKPQEDIFTVDVSKMLRRIPNYDRSVTLQVFLDTYLTESTVMGYATDKFPLMLDGRFRKRLEFYDGFTDRDCRVQYTSAETPEIRDDPYRRSDLNDLVVSSETRDFRNTFAIVNGGVHETIYHKKELFIINGYCSIKNSKKKLLALCDTTSVGGHTTHYLKSEMLINQDDQDIRNSAYIKLGDGVSFEGKTPMMVIDGKFLPLHEDLYTVVSTDTIKIHTNKIDFIDWFLHNAMTHYLHDHFREEEALLADARDVDLMKYYFENVFPHEDKGINQAAISLVSADPWFQFDPCTKGNILIDSGTHAAYPEPSMPEIMRYYFENEYPHADRGTNQAVIQTLDYEPWYHIVNGIRRMMPYEDLTSEAFIFHRLFSCRSMILLINTPTLYRRQYDANRTVEIDQYNIMNDDMPRGFLQYDRSSIIPYVKYSAPDGQHTFSLGFSKPHLDMFKTAYNPTGVISPMFDLESTVPERNVRLLEYYAP